MSTAIMEDTGQDFSSEGVEDQESRSATSTDAYSEHEPFATFEGKVLELCRALWPNHLDQHFHIERMKGGASNRIVLIRVSATSNPDQQQHPRSTGTVEDTDLASGEFILRIPRWGSHTSMHETCMLRFLRERISAGVPTVVHFDTTSGKDNPLGRPYVLQLRVTGRRLDEMWPLLNQTQRLSVCLDLARLCAELAHISNSSGGIPDMESGPAADGTLRTYDHHFPGDDRDSKNCVEPQPPLDMLHKRLARWGKKYGVVGDPWVQATEVAQHMHTAHDTFGAGPDGLLYYLNHGDLFPRNILVRTLPDNVDTVTAILDWDDAYVAPAVISFSPPAWLWMEDWWKDYDDEGFLETEDLWRTAHEEPQEIKELFERVVGPNYLRHAYAPKAHIAQKIWKAAHEPFGSSWTRQQLEDLYKDWTANQAEAGKG